MTRPEMVNVAVKAPEYGRHFIMVFIIVLLLLGNAYHTTALANNPEPLESSSATVFSHKHFPQPAAINRDVAFWMRVYTEISTKEGFIHDSANLSVIYETVPISNKLTRKSRSRHINKVKKKYQKILLTLASGKRTGLSREEQRVLSLWPENVSNRELKRASRRLRFQLGQSNKFREGLVRSGRWKGFIVETLEEMGLPREIAALPHVESSFNYRAYSKVGAAGMWQFTRSTGRRYMRVDHVIDERLDPYIATEAAARLLKNNYAVTGSWPLAITAYNHGAAGMRRASKKTGGKDIVKILRNYKSRSFGFASRNFYPSFLAAVEIDQNPEKYFKNLRIQSPERYEMIELEAYYSIDTIMSVLNVDRVELMAANPALRPAVWNGDKFIPKNYKLRIAADMLTSGQSVNLLIASIDADQRFDLQKPDRFHRVNKGQSLSLIAARYRLRVRDLVAANNLRSKHHIRVGQVLILPEPGNKKSRIEKNEQLAVKKQDLPSIEHQQFPEDGIYVVKNGDNIDSIARKHKQTIATLLKLNNLADKNKIYPGQKLRLVQKKDITIPDNLLLARMENEATATDISATQSAKLPDTAQFTKPVQTTQPMQKKESTSEAPFELNVADTDNNTDNNTERLIENNADESIGDKLLAESKGNLLADPSDYSVNEQRTIEVQAAETLGHYAEWLKIRAWDLRRLNRMEYGKPVVVGQRLKLNFKNVTPQQFESQRLAYHKAIQEAFFEQNQIVGIDKYRLNRGDSVWDLTRETYKIPFWLLRQYNPDLDMNRITADRIITFPKVKQRIDQQS